MAFLKYSDLPIFADFTTENVVPTKTSAKIFAATEASLALDANLAPNRYLGKAQIKNDFSTVGPLEGKFSFTFYPLIEKSDTNLKLNLDKNNQKAFFNLTGNFNQGHQIYFSNFLLKKCLLQSYSVKINPYQPISVTANFIAYDVSGLKNQTLEAYSGSALQIPVDNTTPHYETLHALTTKMNGSSINIPESKISIEINVDCQRTPVYTLGNQVPDSIILNSVERTTTIQGENIGAAVDITGANAGDTNLYFLPLSSLGSIIGGNVLNADHVIKFDINGRISSQQVQIAQNSMLNGRVVIKEIIL